MKIKTYSVSALNNYIAQLLASDIILNSIVVIGEVSSFKKYPSGHAYFTLKDDNSRISCVMFRSYAGAIEHISDGTQVRLVASVNVYQKEGRYQLNVVNLETLGQGAIYEQFLKLKKKLEAEGELDPAKKKALPENIKRVGLITSAKGAAIEDFSSILKRRDPLIEIDFYASNVQGETAVQTMVNALDYFRTNDDVDVVVLTRGGGAKEDLWCFNHEAVARAIIAIETPVVSAVGHQIDFTIADFVADLRAATPSAAAELISPNRYQELDIVYRQLQLSALRATETINSLKKQLLANDPKKLLERQIFYNQEQMMKLDSIYLNINQSLEQKLELLKQKLSTNWQIIASKHPQKQMERGFIYSQDEKGNIIKSVQDIDKKQKLILNYQDGQAIVNVNEVNYEN